MGTPDFAVESLRQLIDAGVDVAAVITSPDRPAGRGQQEQQSAVKEFALSKNLRVLQPEKLKSEDFLAELASINASLFVVVAFRMLPEVVWQMPPKGTINLHGSLLPNYRGAAPINWAVINGEKETGATTFFIEKEIDTGRIIDAIKIPILETDNAGSVHDRLMVDGAQLLTKTVKEILDGEVHSKPQADVIGTEDLKHAPKIFKPDCKIDWNQSSRIIFNKIRGLSPYPTAWTEIIDDSGKTKSIKIFSVVPIDTNTNNSGKITREGTELRFGTSNGWISVKELQLEGKKRMSVDQFLLGFKIESTSLVIA
jgi:methionyl-tRNA formyltransferase